MGHGQETARQLILNDNVVPNPGVIQLMAKQGKAVLAAKIGKDIEFSQSDSHQDIEDVLRKHLPDLFEHLDALPDPETTAKWVVCSRAHKRLSVVHEPFPDGNDVFLNKTGNKANVSDVQLFIGTSLLS
jgi:hypothetical protein